MLRAPGHNYDYRADMASPHRRTAYALAIFPLDIVHRQTIRAMLPAGATTRYATSALRRRMDKGGGKGGARNRVSEAFQRALKHFDEENWIDRGREFVRIYDRGALLDWALRGLLEIPEHFISLDHVPAVIRVGLAEPDLPSAKAAQRHRELRAVQELMKASVQGVHWSGRGSVRFVNKGKAL